MTKNEFDKISSMLEKLKEDIINIFDKHNRQFNVLVEAVGEEKAQEVEREMEEIEKDYRGIIGDEQKEKEAKKCCGWTYKYERETGKKVKGVCSACDGIESLYRSINKTC